MQQLPLEIRLDDHAVFASYWPAGNEAAVHGLQALAAGDGGQVAWLWGPPGSGRTHLLQAAVAATTGGTAAYLPLAGNGLTSESLPGFGAVNFVAVDDISAVAGDREWELALFRLYEEVRAAGGRFLAAGLAPAAETGIGLRDLASRFAAGATWRLKPLDDDGRLRALKQRAAFRGFELPDETGWYLLNRVERDTPGLFRLLDQLDRAALVAQKRLTVPFVKGVLGG